MSRRFPSAAMAVILVVAACGAAPTSPSPSVASPPATSAPSATPSILPSPSTPALAVGSLAKTVSDRLRVRSQPRVSDDSILYEPVLPLGTELTVVSGPVSASDYMWYEVQVAPGTLADGVTRGWVAMADHDGTPWIAVAGAPIAGLEVATSDVARAPADPAAAVDAAAAVNAFAVDAYRRLLDDPVLALSDKNAVFSPASIALALGMTRAGAKGQTGTEMDDVLHVGGWDELGPGLNSLSQALASRNARWVDVEDATREVALRIANTTFAQRGWAVEDDFLDAIAAAFGAGVNLVDYMADPAAARDTINAWVDRQTAGRIPELLTPANVTSATRLYLVNAIYMKAEWDDWFAEDGTTPQVFTRLDGSTIRVPTMVAYRGALSPVAPFVDGDGWQALELRYRSRGDTPQLAMTLVMPDDLARFERSMTAEQLDGIVAGLDAVRDGWHDATPCGSETGCYPYDLELYMPRFGIETRAELGDLLAGLGMPSAFDPAAADFSGIHVPQDPADTLFIKNVIHQANIDVDEKGTEAAAATAVGMDTGGGPSALEQITVRLDHPFLFLLRDVETGAILFMGRVVDPSVGR